MTIALASAGWPLAGFLLVVALWTLLTDGRPGGQHSLDVSSLNPVRAEKTASRLAWRNVDNIFLFGDALSSTGFDPVGAPPTEENIFGNHDHQYYLDINADGPKWINRVATVHNESTVKVYSLAVPAGHVERNAYAPRLQGLGPPSDKTTLREQIDLFQRNFVMPALGLYWEGFARETDRAKTTWDADRTLFASWFGVNDIVESVDKKRLPAGPIFASYAASLERLYQYGARHFLILNAPPIARATKDRSGGLLAAHTLTFNDELDTTLARLSARHADAVFLRLDVHTLWNDALGQPTRFGATANLRELDTFCPAYAETAPHIMAVEKTCGGIPHDQYFWLNALNPTYPVHELTASVLARDCFTSVVPQGYCSLMDEYRVS